MVGGKEPLFDPFADPIPPSILGWGRRMGMIESDKQANDLEHTRAANYCSTGDSDDEIGELRDFLQLTKS